MTILRGITHHAIYGRSFVFLCFHVFYVVNCSRIIFLPVFTKTLQLTRTRKHENTKLWPKSAQCAIALSCLARDNPIFVCSQPLFWWSHLFNFQKTWSRAWSYQQKFSVLRNFQKKSENLKPTFLSQRSVKLSSWCYGSASLLEF